MNITGALLGIKAVMPELKKNGTGSIVNIFSAAGLVGGISTDSRDGGCHALRDSPRFPPLHRSTG